MAGEREGEGKGKRKNLMIDLKYRLRMKLTFTWISFSNNTPCPATRMIQIMAYTKAGFAKQLEEVGNNRCRNKLQLQFVHNKNCVYKITILYLNTKTYMIVKVNCSLLQDIVAYIAGGGADGAGYP